MPANGSKLSPLLSTYDLKLVCSKCCVKEREITYRLKPVPHQCAHDVLLCRAKGASKWRPIASRPAFPNPSQYAVCLFFKEGSGCTRHHNRCYFARSEEEAAVWTFEKRQGLDHRLFCNLLALSERDPDGLDAADPLAELLALLDVKVVCALCSVREKKVTYTVQSVVHKCSREILLAKVKGASQWRPISERPITRLCGPNVIYKVCNYFVGDSGCTQHKPHCTFAKTSEEATVWNFLRERKLGRDELIRLLTKSEEVLSPESAARNLLLQFSGEFLELCQDCFQERPQTLSTKRWHDSCAADAAHQWKPVLVHLLSERSSKDICNQVRPLPPNSQFQYCSHVRQGKPCWHGPSHCQHAQSEVEMAVWKAEHGGFSVRPHLLQLSQRGQTEHQQVRMYCKICLLSLSSPESFYEHCASLEHAQLLREDTTTRWRGRQPPQNQRSQLWLCDRPQTCEYGIKCPKAHSAEELQEWMMRAAEEKDIKENMDAQGLMGYNDRLLEEYRNSCNEVYVMSEQVLDVQISCDQDLTMDCDEMNVTLKWNFQVETERELVHVALLKQEPGALFTLGDAGSVPCIYSSGQHLLTGDTTYTLTVCFTSINPGLFEQWLVLDFGMRPVLVRKLKVRAGQLSVHDAEQSTVNNDATFQGVERWHRGNRAIIPSYSKTEEQELLFKAYKPPQINFLYTSSKDDQTPLTNVNYRQKMHQFLYDEEKAEDEVVSKLNVCGEITAMDNLYTTSSGMMRPPRGELFCAVSIPCNLTLDSPEGMALKRSVHSCLVAPLPSNGPNSKVYEASILPFKTSKKKMYLQMSKPTCADLALKRNESYHMEVQFQLDRFSFCCMHKAVDLLPDTKRVLPDLKNCGVPVSNVTYKDPNTKQQSAINFITGDSTLKKFVAPLLVYGPFGTGKTFTLATAAGELCKNPDNRVLICSHTNSSADLYVRDHFHTIITKGHDKLRPIRIKANKPSALFATDETTLKYCLLSEDKKHFLLPTRAVLDRHNVVITTTTMARHFHGLKLGEGYFTHILIDEASQMLECESLMALGLAGPNTRVVLAGDHMQMGPKLFSVDDEHRSDKTLLTRLFHFYQEQKCDAAQNSRIIFNENYRSTKEIVDFVSTHFYVGKNDVIKASGDVPPPTNGHALTFHHVRGECLLHTMSMTWYNKHEVTKVVEAAKDILEHWPLSWGPKDPHSICILSEGIQVRKIRTLLSRRSLAEVNVENLANVQGKQFRAVIMTAVQTRDSLKTSHLPGLELFNDARVLNTAMTRAQSQVVVVGDAVALCCFGKCSKFWKSFIDHCINNKSVSPQHFTEDFFERDVMETVKFQKSEFEDESNTLSDAILQELTHEAEQLQAECSSEEDSSDDLNHRQPRVSSTISDVDPDIEELCRKNPQMFKHGTLVKESYREGYVIPSCKPDQRVSIKGRENLGNTFSGDEVLVQISEEEAKVFTITKKDESARVLVCILEDECYRESRRNSPDKFVMRTMMPLTKTEPKIRIIIHKKAQSFLPVWKRVDDQLVIDTRKRLDANLKRNNAFLVQVICWKENCYYPLGRIVRILPIQGLYVNELRILNEEFKVAPNTSKQEKNSSLEDEDRRHRRDMSGVITFTVDPEGSKDLDDAISVRDVGEQYELGIHIADVASFVSQNSDLDENAKKRGFTYYCRGAEANHMFPQDLSTGVFSLLKSKKRRVISLIFRVEKKKNKIVKQETKFQLSVIESNRQLSYEEAEDIITARYKGSPKFDGVEDCVTVAYCFAKAQKRMRVTDWEYSQTDDDRLPGKCKAHLMIEELSLLFNNHASERLLRSDKTSCKTPLRCQDKPNPVKIEKFKEKYGELIPLSFHVRHKIDSDEQAQRVENFRILTDVWTDIQSAAKSDDTDKMVDLVAADDIHLTLHSVIIQFRRCSNPSYTIRSNSCPEAKIGHYSLNLLSYTQASSPIRRYLDLILQRLLHAIICDRDVSYSQTDIAALCAEFENKQKKAKMYEQKTEQIFYAVSVKKQSAPKLAFVVTVDSNEDNFAVSFPFNKNIFPVSLKVMYRDLQLEDQPLYDEGSCSVTLTWKRRIYSADTVQIHHELKWIRDCGPCIELPLHTWEAVIETIDKGNFDQAKFLILNAETKQQGKKSVPAPSSVTTTSTSEAAVAPKGQIQHLVDINLQLQPGDILKVQMTSEIKRGYDMPTIQLIYVKPKFEVCVDHVHSPITCFSRLADDPSKFTYLNTEDYVRIWKPLCEMESAATAVADSNSIIIENLVVNFTQNQKGTLSGSFFLPVQRMTEWAIECDLSQCLLCIRKRGLKLPSVLEHSALGDPQEFTWVAHGVTVMMEEKENVGTEVAFHVNHLPMETIPNCVFQKNTHFTVEIIPKLLTDIRNENAVMSIKTACHLVKSIALGRSIPNNESSVVRMKIFNGLEPLNDSQNLAVNKALSNALTLIHGPPGTGKTVVGVRIVLRFFEQNSQHPQKSVNSKDKEKKEVILYCGPSNKSVDVVAEYLMKFQDTLKPLRVYGYQVERLDYPYPDCTLQFTQRKHRQEKAKQELKSITMHHRMREGQNEYSGQIKDFDERIKLAQQKKGKQLTVAEIEEYRKLLLKARAFELQRHNVILCTCTQSSSPFLTKAVCARQILIDEAAMATEPQTLTPLVCNKPEKIVLIGDHKQLRPIVTNQAVKKLGMSKSLFERYHYTHYKSTVMLETQYRMHEDICKFPSKEFYNGWLKTGKKQPASILLVDKKTMPVVFGHVTGKTVSLVVSTDKGSQNSKANREERDVVIKIAEKLVNVGKIKQQDIVILSPYNAQVSEIKEELRKKKNMEQITATTISKSQGSEWRYVLISTVCSLESEWIPAHPDRAWVSKHLGFVADANQTNVAITRAKEGLCIIGNQEVLRCSATWDHLLSHYRANSAVTDADKISVR